MGHARQERVKLVGTRSADYIRASGHCGCIAMGQASTRKQAVYMAAPERFAKKTDLLLQRGHRPYMARNGHADCSPSRPLLDVTPGNCTCLPVTRGRVTQLRHSTINFTAILPAFRTACVVMYTAIGMGKSQ